MCATTLQVVIMRSAAFLALAALVSARLEFDSSSSSILFGNDARLTAACPSCASPPPPLLPGISRFAPKRFAPLYPGSTVQVRLQDVRLSCAGAAANQPCALAFDSIDEPAWWCNWNSSYVPNGVATGPMSASISTLHEINTTDLHAAHTGCAKECDLRPANVLPVLACPVPDVVSAGLLPSGFGDIFLHVTYYMPMGDVDAVPMPHRFPDTAAGVSTRPTANVHRVSVSLTPPSPPEVPPTPPPSPVPAVPPPPPSPPTVVPGVWYALTSGASAGSGTDHRVRFFPVYAGSMQAYSYSAYRCVHQDPSSALPLVLTSLPQPLVTALLTAHLPAHSSARFTAPHAHAPLSLVNVHVHVRALVSAGRHACRTAIACGTTRTGATRGRRQAPKYMTRGGRLTWGGTT